MSWNNRESKKDKEARRKRLLESKEYLENTLEVINYYTYIGMSIPEKEELQRQWEDYYKAVLESRAYKRFHEMKEVFKEAIKADGKDGKFVMGEHPRFKQLWEESHQAVVDGTVEVAKPQMESPEEIMHNRNVSAYFDTCDAIRKLDPEGYLPGSSPTRNPIPAQEDPFSDDPPVVHF